MALMANIKASLSRGLRSFETYERDTLRAGAATVIGALRSLPSTMQEYYTRLSDDRLGNPIGRD